MGDSVLTESLWSLHLRDTAQAHTHLTKVLAPLCLWATWAAWAAWATWAAWVAWAAHTTVLTGSLLHL